MKKIIIAICVLVLCISAVGGANWLFGNIGGPVIHYNGCTAYSKEDVASAAQVVIEKVDSMDGCVLFSLKYAGNGDLEYCRELNPDADYVECIVFDSVFRSPLTGLGAWNNNSIYTWSWTLAREEGGPWEIDAWGYA